MASERLKEAAKLLQIGWPLVTAKARSARPDGAFEAQQGGSEHHR